MNINLTLTVIILLQLNLHESVSAFADDIELFFTHIKIKIESVKKLNMTFYC